MVTGNYTTIRYEAEELTYADACRIAEKSEAAPGAVLLDLDRTEKTTTAALARLIQLRSSLLGRGGDILIAGLAGQAESLYQISRLAGVLPRQQRMAC